MSNRKLIILRFKFPLHQWEKITYFVPMSERGALIFAIQIPFVSVEEMHLF